MKKRVGFRFISSKNLFVVLFQTYTQNSPLNNSHGARSRIIIETTSPEEAEKIVREYFGRQNLQVKIEVIGPVQVLTRSFPKKIFQ